MAKPSKLDRAISDANGVVEECSKALFVATAVRDALLSVGAEARATATPKTQRGRKKKGLPNGAEVTA